MWAQSPEDAFSRNCFWPQNCGDFPQSVLLGRLHQLSNVVQQPIVKSIKCKFSKSWIEIDFVILHPIRRTLIFPRRSSVTRRSARFGRRSTTNSELARTRGIRLSNVRTRRRSEAPKCWNRFSRYLVLVTDVIFVDHRGQRHGRGGRTRLHALLFKGPSVPPISDSIYRGPKIGRGEVQR